MASPTIHLHMIDVEAPVQVVFDKWAQYESFPLFMKSVEAVAQLAASRLRWRVKIAGLEREFETTVTDETPANRIAWTAESGSRHTGEVTFHEIDGTTTWIVLEIEHNPDGFLEHVADRFGIVSARIEGELKSFKAYVEANA